MRTKQFTLRYFLPFLFFLCSFSFKTHAQITSSVISAAGGFDKNQSIKLDWVLGESFIDYGSTQTQMLTEGFLQPIKLKKLNLNPGGNFNVAIYPNPFQSLLSIKILTPVHEKLSVKLLDSKGNLLTTTILNPDQITEFMNLSNIATGIYILHISNTLGNISSSYLVNKVR